MFEKCAVTGIDVNENEFGMKKVSAVHTSSGTVRTDCVVNCTGQLFSYLYISV